MDSRQFDKVEREAQEIMARELKGRDPIRGPLRWSDAEWAEVQSALAKSGKSYAEVARRLILSWARRLAAEKRKPGRPKV